ncbi:MAG: hypothetical protein HUK21_13020, partial [Fibrobacteraceae bacterium]|nr:hypothetical protein [Fibrobacteraceae bacterium]
SNHGARLLDPMLGLWISVDPARQFASPYLYAGNGVNPIGFADEFGAYMVRKRGGRWEIKTFSKAEAVTGWLVRDVPGVIFSFLPSPIGVFYGAAKAGIQDYNAGSSSNSMINALGTSTNFVTNSARDAVISGKYTAGSAFGTLFSAFDAKLGYDNLNSLVDSPEFIAKFESRMVSNGGTDYNSFDSYEAADAYAQKIMNQQSYEPNGDVSVGDISCDNCQD